MHKTVTAISLATLTISGIPGAIAWADPTERAILIAPSHEPGGDRPPMPMSAKPHSDRSGSIAPSTFGAKTGQELAQMDGSQNEPDAGTNKMEKGKAAKPTGRGSRKSARRRPDRVAHSRRARQNTLCETRAFACPLREQE